MEVTHPTDLAEVIQMAPIVILYRDELKDDDFGTAAYGAALTGTKQVIEEVKSYLKDYWACLR
jgi:hypothetical protein